MPRPKRGPHIYRRPGSDLYYAYLDRVNRHISLKTDDEEQARINFGDLLHRRAAQIAAPKKGELGGIFVECAKRAKVNHTPAYAADVNLRLSRLDRWLDANGVKSPDRVTLGLVEKYKSDERERGITDRTINRYLDTWKKAMKLAVEEGFAPPRVLTYFRKLKEPRVEPHQRGLSLEEIDGFLKCVEDERYYWLLRTVAGSGIRDDEVRHLEPQCVRDAAIVITPLPPGLCGCHSRGWNTKNYRNRTIPASAETVACARLYVEVKHSMNLDAKHVWKIIQAARKAAGHTWHWSMHELRRAWGSHMLASGVKLSDLSRWYGHGDVKTTMRYLRVVEDEMPDPSTLPF